MKIPIIRASENLPQIPVTATTEGAGQTWDAVGRLSGVVRDITLDLAHTQQRIRMARELSQAEIEMEVANKDIESKLRLKANPDTYVQDWAAQFEGFAAKRLEGVKGVRTKAAMEQMFSSFASREAPKQKDYANKLFVETEKTEIAKALQGYAAEGKKDAGLKLIDATSDLYGPKELLGLKNDFTTMYHKTQKELSDVAADQAIIDNAHQAVIDLQNPDYLPHLAPMQRQDKVEKARAAAIEKDNKLEAAIEKNQKAIMNTNDSQAVADFYDKKLTWDDLKKRRQTQVVENRISEATFDKLAALMNKDEKIENNAFVVGDLAQRIGAGEDVGSLLLEALNRGQIKGETYISMKKALGNERASMAVRIINQALQPSQLERWSPDKNVKHAEATQSLLNKIEAGKDPVEAAKEIIEEYTGHIIRTRNGLPTPKYLEGDKSDLVALEKAQQVTSTAYELGTMTVEEYKRQTQIISDLKKIIQDSAQSDAASKTLQDILKQVKR